MKQVIKISLIIAFSSIFLSCNLSGNDSSTYGQEIKAKDIIKDISNEKDVYFENAIINGDLDFRLIKKYSKENKALHCFYASQSICFINCTFNGSVIFSGMDLEKNFFRTCFLKGLTFKNCIFKKEAIASNCEYRGLTDFSNSIFEAKADFSGSYFVSKDVIFSEVSFNDELQFSNTRFNGNLSFMKSFFKGNTYFQNMACLGNVMFANSIFAAYTDFTNASFTAIVNFNYAEFRQKTIINYVKFSGRADFVETVFKTKTEIKECAFYSISRFSKTEFSGNTIMENNVFVSHVPECKDLTTSKGSEFIFTNNTLGAEKKIEKFDLIEITDKN
jgi:uncharacterized protein YjbI with pentapeptide repeats